MSVAITRSSTTPKLQAIDLFKVSHRTSVAPKSRFAISYFFNFDEGLIQSILVVSLGVEGTQGITAMAISHNKKYLAICERAPQAVCFVYETQSLKRRRILTTSESVAKEFIDVKFAYSDEKLTNFLFTLVSIFTHSFRYL